MSPIKLKAGAELDGETQAAFPGRQESRRMVVSPLLFYIKLEDVAREARQHTELKGILTETQGDCPAGLLSHKATFTLWIRQASNTQLIPRK